MQILKKFFGSCPKVYSQTCFWVSLRFSKILSKIILPLWIKFFQISTEFLRKFYEHFSKFLTIFSKLFKFFRIFSSGKFTKNVFRNHFSCAPNHSCRRAVKPRILRFPVIFLSFFIPTIYFKIHSFSFYHVVIRTNGCRTVTFIVLFYKIRVPLLQISVQYCAYLLYAEKKKHWILICRERI